jgi:hypothetical protein
MRVNGIHVQKVKRISQGKSEQVRASQSKSGDVWIKDTVCTCYTWNPLTTLGARSSAVLHCLHWLHLEPAHLLYYCLHWLHLEPTHLVLVSEALVVLSAQLCFILCQPLGILFADLHSVRV